ncbi:Bgt-50924 [Blumeria graminis f. sp. tritici]|uniref:Bgt-50924 n=1 Tax=Blumeria graminis f. sp. tritici TaxID=62690 RepID=A0A9X9PRA7_BLUGR|nr:Bgt-50924 [Blumeria graminis f. sp. tritici]
MGLRVFRRSCGTYSEYAS